MRRRTFIAGLGGAAAWPVVARAQQTLPVVAFLAAPPLETLRPYLDRFNQSLKDAGYIDGQNVSIEYRLGGGFNQMPTLAAELVDRQVRVLVAGGGAQVAIKNATTTIPIVSIFAGDPVKSGVVASLNRPGGNVTGVNMLPTRWERSASNSCTRPFRPRRSSRCSSIQITGPRVKKRDE